MKNRKLILIVSLVLAMTMSLGGTLAYLQDTDADVNVMTLGSVTITQNEHQRVQNADGTYPIQDIDGQDSYVLEVYENDKPLLPIVGDPNEPGNSPAYAGFDETTVRMSQIGSYGGMQVFAGKNAQDKFVTVTNTGKTDAFVRTFVAIEIGEGDAALIGTSYHNTWAKNTIGKVEINGVNYYVTEYDYQGGKLSDGSWRHGNGILPAGDTTYPSLAQVYLKSKATNEDMVKFDGNKNGKLDILVLSQAIQADGFAATAEKSAAQVALDTGFGEATAENIAKWFGETEIGTPGKDWPSNDVPVMAEITVDSVDALIKAVKDGYTVIGLANGEYDIQGLGGVKGITLTGSKDAVIKIMNEGEDGCDYGFDGATVTFNGVTFDTSANNGNYKGFARMEATFNNCNFVGSYTTFDNTQFNNCSFNLKNNYVWTWGASKVDFNNCVFEDENGVAKAILVHGGTSATVTVNNCTFKATEPAKTWDGIDVAAVSIDPTNAATIYTINFIGENTVSDAFNGLVQVKYKNEASQVTINQ